LQFFSTTATNFSLSSSSSLFHQQKQNDEKLLPSLHEILKSEKKTEENGDNSDSSKQILIVLNFIATKSIQTGDEIFLDYGKEWEDDFSRYIDSWTAPPPRSHNSSKNKNNAVIQPYTSNIHRPIAFRKSIGMPDDVFPVVWRDKIRRKRKQQNQ
jgi:hypothetical protein